MKTVARPTLGWAFGMSVSILLLALWGRAVVVDTDTLGESLSPLAGSNAVVDYLTDWMSEELVDSGLSPEMVEPTVGHIMEASAVGDTLDLFVIEVIDAAASPDPGGAAIDMAALVHPAVPEVTSGLNGLGYPVNEAEVSDVVEDFEPLVIRRPGSPALVGPTSPTAARLGTAALLASAALLAFGFGFVSLSEDRVGAVRSLATRVAVGALSFAVFLRVGSWVLDPEGGRAPIPETLSALAGSKWAVPLQVALVAAAVAAAIYGGRRLLRRGAASRSRSGRSTQQPEQPKALSGSR